MAALFFMLGVVSGGFAARIPAVKADLHLSAGALGLVLLGPALGCVLSTPVTGIVLQHVAPRRWIAFGIVPFAVMLPVAGFVHGPLGLFGSLLIWGVGMGAVDVSMNTEATRVQADAGRRIMASFHALYSVGALIGAGIGALAALASVAPRVQWSILGALALAAGLLAITGLPTTAVAPADLQPGDAGPRRDGGDRDRGDRDGGDAAASERARGPRRRSRLDVGWPLVALAVICFAGLLSEGAASDWSAVYLHTSLGAAPAVATLAYVGFTATMVIGRLTGDRLTTRFGPVRLVRTGTLLGAVGLGAGLAVANPVVAVAGFALLGVGLSVCFPLAITAASGLGTAGSAVAVVTSCGYVGMLSGPAVIGGLASVVSLPAALGLVVVLCVLLAALAGTLSVGGRTLRGKDVTVGRPRCETPWAAAADEPVL